MYTPGMERNLISLSLKILGSHFIPWFRMILHEPHAGTFFYPPPIGVSSTLLNFAQLVAHLNVTHVRFRH